MYTVLTGARHAPRIVVRPNRSLSVAGLVAVCLGLSLYLLALAALFWKTAWTVVPFLFAEMIVIGAVVWLLRRHARDREALVFAGDRVRVRQRVGARESWRELSRYWARVSLEAPRVEHDRSRLYIGSHGRWVEIGACLNEDERRALARELKALLGPNYRDPSREAADQQQKEDQ